MQTGVRKETGGYQPISRIISQAHFHPASTIMTTGGIRGSKSFSMAMDALTWLPHSDLIWLVGLTYDDAKQEFEYIAEAAQSLDWVSRITWPQNKYQPCVLETRWGAVVETKAGADEASLMSRAPDFVGLCEPGKMTIGVYRKSLERLSTRRGKLWAAGTFENTAPWMENFWRQWKRWPNEDNAKAFSSPTYSNRIVFPQGIHDPAYQRVYRAAMFSQEPGQESAGVDEWYRRLIGVPASSPEIIFSKIFKPRDHVSNVEWIKKRGTEYEPVYLAIDPGYSGNSRYVVLAIQVIGKTIRVIDEVVAQYKNHHEMKAESAKREWWPFAHTGTIDPYAGESKVYGAVTSPADEWRSNKDKYGPVQLTSPQRLPNTEEEIRMASQYFSGINGYTIQISTRCERLRFELATWKRKKVNNVLGDPEKKNNDAIKALIYFLTHHRNGMIRAQRDDDFRVMPYSLTGARLDPILLMQEEEIYNGREREIWGSNEGGLWLP